jgi:hypothetical protein
MEMIFCSPSGIAAGLAERADSGGFGSRRRSGVEADFGRPAGADLALLVALSLSVRCDAVVLDSVVLSVSNRRLMVRGRTVLRRFRVMPR